MLRLETVVRLETSGIVERTHFPLGGQPFLGFDLSRATLLSTFMSPTIQCCSAIADALRGFYLHTLMTNTERTSLSTATSYLQFP
jgi:hypothetical protein